MIRDQRDWLQTIREMSVSEGAAIRQKDGAWEVVDRRASWKFVAASIFDEYLKKLQTVAIEVLSEIDPQFDLPPEERYAAAIHKKVLSHSRELRSGICETLALIANAPELLTSASSGHPEAVPVIVVRSVLEKADWVLWASLNDCLPTIAEAAPQEFLDAVEEAIAKVPSPFIEVLAQETSGFGGRTYMTGLLWGLETLAWHPEHLAGATLALGGLARLDPGGNWANRPSNSLLSIFLPWHPQTLAPIDARVSAVRALMREQPEVAWDLLLELLPNVTRTTSGTHKPRWREWVPADYEAKVDHADYVAQVTAYAAQAVEMAASDHTRLADLIPRLPNLPKESFTALLAVLRSKDIAALPDDRRFPLWEALSDVVSKHRRYSDAEWAMSDKLLKEVDDVARSLAPSSPELLNHHLFTKREWDLYDPKANYEEERKRLDRERRQVVSDLLAAGGLERVRGLAAGVEAPRVVGIALGAVAEPAVDAELLPGDLSDERPSARELAEGFAFGRFLAKGIGWVDTQVGSAWPALEKARLLELLPFEKWVWDRAAGLGSDEALYWKKVWALTAGDRPELLEAVSKLMQYERPIAALECLGRLLSNKIDFDPALAIRALDAAVTTTEPRGSLEHYTIEEIFVWLQGNPKTDKNALATLEWAYLPAFGYHGRAKPRTLESALASSPEQFVRFLSLCFKSKKAKKSEEAEPSEEKKKVASNAYHLLQEWRRVPGTTPEGNFDGAVFKTWLAEVKRLAAECGRLDIAMHTVGQVLPYSPPDPGGLWIHTAVAEALNARDADSMRSGYTNRLFNMRGVFTFTAGKAEREIAAGYRKNSVDAAQAGFPRLAATLRGMAERYERDAAHEAKRDPLKD